MILLGKLLLLTLNIYLVICTCDMTTQFGSPRMVQVCDSWCRMEEETDEIGPRIYTCSNTNYIELNQLTTTYSFDTHIAIKNSIIESLEPGEFKWNRIVELRLADTNTSKLIPGFLNGFSNLKVLWIINNNLTEILSGVFSSASNLDTLNLTNNQISSLAEHSFSGLSELKNVDLSKNKIVYLPPDIFKYQNSIRHVDISQNMIQTVGEIFHKFQPNIQIINFSKNNLSKFDIEFHNVQMVKLDLSDNYLREFSDLSNSSENTFQEVSLANNKLKIIPKFDHVQTFNLSGNQIENIDEIILGSSIKSCDMSRNAINSISNKALKNLTNLEYLYLSHNNLTYLPPDSLSDLRNLQYLDLSFNHLKSLSYGLFNNLTKLTYLDISDNNMILDIYTLSTVTSLRELHFRNNKIKKFDITTVLTRFENLQKVTLDDNTWNCTDLASMIHHLQLKSVSIAHGTNTKGSNILGISCKDNIDVKEESIVVQRDNDVNKDMNSNDQVKEFDDTIKNTQLFKYLKTIAQYISQNSTVTFQNISRKAEEHKFIEYLNRNFTGSSFYNFTQNLEHFLENTSNLVNDMHKYFDKGFNESNIVKLMNSFENDNGNKRVYDKVDIKPLVETQNESRFILRYMNSSLSYLTQSMKDIINLHNVSLNAISSYLNNYMNSSKFAVVDKENIQSKALTGDSSSDKSQKITNNLVLIDVILILVLFCLLIMVYRILHERKKTTAVYHTQEQVQLM